VFAASILAGILSARLYVPYPLLHIVAFLLFITVFSLARKRSWSFYGFSRPSGRDMKAAFYFLLLLFPISLAGRLAAGDFDLWFAGQYGLLAGNLAFFFLTIPVFAFSEELYARSIIQSNLEGIFGPLLASVAVSAHFALLHLGGPYMAVVVASVFFGSLVISLLYSLTRNILTVFLVHAASNALVAGQIVLHASGQAMLEYMYWGIYGALFLVFLPKTAKQLRGLAISGKKLSPWMYVLLAIVSLAPLALFL
jgi:membrane protease YdiL (CAAX protease family)